MMIRAVLAKDVLWPQKQEDREEGGWKSPPPEKATRANGTATANGGVNWPGLVDQESPAVFVPTGSRPQDRRPVAAGGMIDEAVRGRFPRQDDEMV